MSEEKDVLQEDVEPASSSIVDKSTSWKAEFAGRPFLLPARRQHFYFTHQYLDERLIWDVDHALADQLCGDSATEYLRELWLSVGAWVKADQEALIPADELECFPFYIDRKHRGAIVRFPEPELNGEAYFAAVVFCSDPKTRDLSTRYRFFILELRRDLDGSKRAVLCERSYGKDYDYGKGCEPERGAFVEYLMREFFEPDIDLYDPEADRYEFRW